MHPILNWMHRDLRKLHLRRKCPSWVFLITLVVTMIVSIRLVASGTDGENTAALWAIPVVLGVPGFLLALASGYRAVAFALLGIASISFVGFCVAMII